MEILNSLEVRWFLDDIQSNAATALRSAFQDVSSEGDRLDLYLVTGRNDLGFKARGEAGKSVKVETKYLLGSLGATQLHKRFTGDVERWRKLSLELTDPTLRDHGEWISVEKKRRLQKYACEAGTVTPVPRTAFPPAGCGVELTELVYETKSGRKSALTFGLEAFGPEITLLDVLIRVCSIALDGISGLDLVARDSESYPSWIGRVTGS